MNTKQPTFRAAGLLAASALMLGLAACGERVDNAGAPPANNPTVGQRMEKSAGSMAQNVERKVDDAAITASVNASLAKDPDLSAMKINVDTKSGVVTLNGPAPTPAAKDRATSLAQAVDGVAGVNNNLQVRTG